MKNICCFTERKEIIDSYNIVIAWLAFQLSPTIMTPLFFTLILFLFVYRRPQLPACSCLRSNSAFVPFEVFHFPFWKEMKSKPTSCLLLSASYRSATASGRYLCLSRYQNLLSRWHISVGPQTQLCMWHLYLGVPLALPDFLKNVEFQNRTSNLSIPLPQWNTTPLHSLYSLDLARSLGDILDFFSS